MPQNSKDKQIKKINVDKDIQYNSQDLDQEQNVDVKPVQLNTQNLHIDVLKGEGAQIIGLTVFARSKEIAAGTSIALFFGHHYKEPVYRTCSDENGNFTIKNLPPGYYTIYARRGRQWEYESHFIKLFANQTIEHVVMLM